MADPVDDMLFRVTYHAVTRYVQRILGVVITNPAFPSSERMVAAAHTASVGKSVDDIRREILSPPVIAALAAGLTHLRTTRLRVQIAQPSGMIVTVLAPKTRRHGKVRTLSRREAHRNSQCGARRGRGRPSPAIAPAPEPAE